MMGVLTHDERTNSEIRADYAILECKYGELKNVLLQTIGDLEKLKEQANKLNERV